MRVTLYRQLKTTGMMWVVLVGLYFAGSIGSVLAESPARNQDSPGKKNKPQGSVPAQSPALSQDPPGKKKKPQASVPAESLASNQDSPGKKSKPQGSVPAQSPALNQDSSKNKIKPKGPIPTESPARNQYSAGKKNEPQGVTAISGCYGNIMEVPTTGADCETAKHYNLSYCGVPASQKIAETVLEQIDKYKTEIFEVGRRMCMDPAVIAGMISHLACGRDVFTNASCDGENHFGLMKISKGWYNVRGTWNSNEHISQGIEILIFMINQVKKKFPSWSQVQQLKGGIAAYMIGAGSITSAEEDYQKIIGDFSNDVVARAQYYKQHGY